MNMDNLSLLEKHLSDLRRELVYLSLSDEIIFRNDDNDEITTYIRNMSNYIFAFQVNIDELRKKL
jgi:hypothetical protein